MILSYLQCVALIFWALEYWRMDTERPKKANLWRIQHQNLPVWPTDQLTDKSTARSMGKALCGATGVRVKRKRNGSHRFSCVLHSSFIPWKQNPNTKKTNFTIFSFLLFSPFSPFSVRLHPFLVACYATLHPALLVHPSVHQAIGPSVHRSVTLYFFWFLRSLASLLLPKWSSGLKYSPCPPARDWGSRVSGLVTPPPCMMRGAISLNMPMRDNVVFYFRLKSDLGLHVHVHVQITPLTSATLIIQSAFITFVPCRDLSWRSRVWSVEKSCFSLFNDDKSGLVTVLKINL